MRTDRQSHKAFFTNMFNIFRSVYGTRFARSSNSTGEYSSKVRLMINVQYLILRIRCIGRLYQNLEKFLNKTDEKPETP